MKTSNSLLSPQPPNPGFFDRVQIHSDLNGGTAGVWGSDRPDLVVHNGKANVHTCACTEKRWLVYFVSMLLSTIRSWVSARPLIFTLAHKSDCFATEFVRMRDTKRKRETERASVGLVKRQIIGVYGVCMRMCSCVYVGGCLHKHASGRRKMQHWFDHSAVGLVPA